MLVLSRKRFERVVVGPITITIVGCRRGDVRLGIEAPKEMEIRRLRDDGRNDGKETR